MFVNEMPRTIHNANDTVVQNSMAARAAGVRDEQGNFDISCAAPDITKHIEFLGPDAPSFRIARKKA